MSSASLHEVAEAHVAATEERFRLIAEQSLSGVLDRRVPVSATQPQILEFKQLKASLPGEVVAVTLFATEGGPGRIIYAVAKENAGRLADLLLLGDGSASFSHDEHLEPMRDFFREVTASFASELGKELGRHIAFDDVKATLVDLTPGDFVGVSWVITCLEFQLDPAICVYRIVSKDFIDACYPESQSSEKSHEAVIEEDSEHEEYTHEMGLVLDIQLPITIELGRTQMLIRDIVKLAPGSIVELDKLSGEPVDLFVNNRKFARGEVVVVDENFAVRITELITPNERMRASRN